MIITLMGADFSASNIGTLSSWRITRSLGSGAIYEGVTSVDKGASFNATVTIAEGYELGSAGVTVTMGGNTISAATVSGNVITITIAEVTGNVVIKVPTVNITTGEEEEPETPDTPDVPGGGSGDSSGTGVLITDLSVYEQAVGYPNNAGHASNWAGIKADSNFKHIAVPVPETGCVLKMTAAGAAIMYCGLKSYETPTAAASPREYSEDAAWNTRLNLPANQSVTKPIADDVKYIILVVLNAGTDAYPVNFEISKA